MSKGPRCPFLNKPCIEHDCMLYTHVTMQSNPQTGASEDKWGCAIAWMPIMIIQNAQQTRNVAASVDSMRNEVVQRQDTLNAAIETARSGHESRRIVDAGVERLPGSPPSDVSSSESVER